MMCHKIVLYSKLFPEIISMKKWMRGKLKISFCLNLNFNACNSLRWVIHGMLFNLQGLVSFETTKRLLFSSGNLHGM